MIFRSTLICIMCSLPLTAMFATSSWAGCPGTWIEGRNCVCPDGSSATTSDLTNWHCPRSSGPSRAAPAKITIPNDLSAKNTRKALKDEADAEKKLAEAEEAERRTRKMLDAGKGSKEAAEKVLSDANKKVAALQKKVDATDDPAKKIELLKEQLAIKKSMLPVVRGRDQMGRSVSNYENKLRTAEHTTARARAKLAQAKQARIAAVTKRSPSSSFRSQSSTAKSVRNPEREVVAVKKDIAKANSSTKRAVDSARDKWQASQRKTLDLAAKWGQAAKDGDTAKATALYADLQKAQATNKRYEAQFREVESSSADTASLPKKLSTAQQKVTALEQNKQATPRATPAPQAKSKASPATTTTPKYSLTGKQQPGLQTKVAEEPNQIPTTKFTWVNGNRKPDWKTATVAQREEYLAKVNKQLQEGQKESERLDRKVKNYDRAIAGVKVGRAAIVGCLAGPGGCAAGATTGIAVDAGTHTLKSWATKVDGEKAGHAVDFGAIGLHAAAGDLPGAWDGIVMKGMDVYYNGFNY